MQPLNLANYAHEKVYATVDQIVDHNRPLDDKCKERCHSLAQSFIYYTFEYACSLMDFLFTVEVNPAGVTYAITVNHANSKKVLKDDYHTLMLDGRHGRRSVEMVSDEAHLVLAPELLRMQHLFRITGKLITQLRQSDCTRYETFQPRLFVEERVLSILYRVSSTMRQRLKRTTRLVSSTCAIRTSSMI